MQSQQFLALGMQFYLHCHCTGHFQKIRVLFENACGWVYLFSKQIDWNRQPLIWILISESPIKIEVRLSQQSIKFSYIVTKKAKLQQLNQYILQLLPLNRCLLIKLINIPENNLSLLFSNLLPNHMLQAIANHSQWVELITARFYLLNQPMENNPDHFLMLSILIDRCLRKILQLEQSIPPLDQFQSPIENSISNAQNSMIWNIGRQTHI